MKKFTKLLGIVLIIALVMSMGTAAFAASITITHDASYDTNVDATNSTARIYSAYKIFDAKYTTLSGANTQGAKDTFEYIPEDAPVAYTMATNSPWKDVMLASGQTWFDVELAADGSVYVITPKVDKAADGTVTKEYYKTTEDAQAFAAYLEQNIPEDASASEVTVDASSATSVDPGYYFIVAKDAKDASTRVALVTTDVTMVEKNTYVSTTKDTEETSYTIGDTVTYTATVTIPSDTAITKTKGENDTDSDNDGYADGHGPVVLHDEMASVLAFKNDVTAKIGETAFTGFTVKATGLDDDCTFEVTIPVTADVLGKTITFTYSAELTSAAINPDTGFINKLFGEINDYQTTPDSPQVYTFDFDFSKEFVGSTDSSLVATFELCTTEDGKLPLAADAAADAVAKSSAIKLIAGSSAGSYIVADSDDTNTTTTIESANNAAINVQGLKAGTYYLIEKTTSTGYNMLDGAVAVVITDTTTKNEDGSINAISHTVTVGGNASTEASPAKIQNNSGTVLPSTGGIGTTIFYVVGSILVVAAGVLLITKKRMSREG